MYSSIIHRLYIVHSLPKVKSPSLTFISALPSATFPHSSFLLVIAILSLFPAFPLKMMKLFSLSLSFFLSFPSRLVCLNLNLEVITPNFLWNANHDVLCLLGSYKPHFSVARVLLKVWFG